jgi:chemotaxis protein histidine kinase CheA
MLRHAGARGKKGLLSKAAEEIVGCGIAARRDLGGAAPRRDAWTTDAGTFRGSTQAGSPMNDPPNIDPALLELFRAEMDTHVPVLSQGLLELEKGRAGEQEIASMMRAAHSIKGAARIVGIEAAVRLAHVMEDCFTAAKEARVRLTSEAVDVLLQGVDALQRICSLQPGPDLSETLLQSLHDRLAAVKDGRTPSRVADRTPTSSDVGAAASLAAPAAAAGELCIRLPAELDDTAADVLRRQLVEALSQGTPQIRLDFTQVKRLSASAMAVLLSYVREVARAEQAPVLAVDGVAGSLAILLRVSGLDCAWASSG